MQKNVNRSTVGNWKWSFVLCRTECCNMERWVGNRAKLKKPIYNGYCRFGGSVSSQELWHPPITMGRPYRCVLSQRRRTTFPLLSLCWSFVLPLFSPERSASIQDAGHFLCACVWLRVKFVGEAVPYTQRQQTNWTNATNRRRKLVLESSFLSLPYYVSICGIYELISNFSCFPITGI